MQDYLNRLNVALLNGRTVQEMQLNEMMHVDIKIGIDMQSCWLQMRAEPGRSHAPFVHKFLFANQ